MGHLESTPTDLMRDADVAMYQAKAHGKDQVETYDASMHGLVVQGYELRTELAEAIESRAFILHYQPAIDLASGGIVGAEALVRWAHPDRGLLAPSEFIPQAESAGLIVRLGSWILREACATAATWPTLPDGRQAAISVNLAAAQVHHPGLVDEIAAILRETGLAPDRLVLEVTESALVDMHLARATMRRLHDLGVLIALDDFGTGYSALSYLAELPFDIVKIDQSFVASMGQGDRSDALLKGIIGLCDALELITVAEGIEEGAQLERLVGLGCQVGQGYLFSRPVPAARLVDLFAGWDQSARRLAPGGATVTPGIRRGLAAAD
jgi:EAL domain-containing protein (putative c-di-GMP-specific phosphodiesterase class I)